MKFLLAFSDFMFKYIEKIENSIYKNYYPNLTKHMKKK